MDWYFLGEAPFPLWSFAVFWVCLAAFAGLEFFIPQRTASEREGRWPTNFARRSQHGPRTPRASVRCVSSAVGAQPRRRGFKFVRYGRCLVVDRRSDCNHRYSQSCKLFGPFRISQDTGAVATSPGSPLRYDARHLYRGAHASDGAGSGLADCSTGVHRVRFTSRNAHLLRNRGFRI